MGFTGEPWADGWFGSQWGKGAEGALPAHPLLAPQRQAGNPAREGPGRRLFPPPHAGMLEDNQLHPHALALVLVSHCRSLISAVVFSQLGSWARLPIREGLLGWGVLLRTHKLCLPCPAPCVCPPGTAHFLRIHLPRGDTLEPSVHLSQRYYRAGRFSNTFQCCKSVSRSVVADSLQPHGLSPTRLLCPWDSSDKNTGAGSPSLQGIFPTQGSNPGLLHWRQILYHLSHQGSPNTFNQVLNVCSKHFQMKDRALEF